MNIWPKGLNDLMDEPGTAYSSLNDDLYNAENGLLELYRNFVTEMLRMSLAGIAVIGFLTKFLKDGETLPCLTKIFGMLSMGSFALSSILALLFLYASAEGYRYYISGLRSKLSNKDILSNKYLVKRRKSLQKCVWSKAGSAIFLGLGAFFACGAIFLVL